MKLNNSTSNIIFLEKGFLSSRCIDADHHWADTFTKPSVKMDSRRFRKSKRGLLSKVRFVRIRMNATSF